MRFPEAPSRPAMTVILPGPLSLWPSLWPSASESEIRSASLSVAVEVSHASQQAPEKKLKYDLWMLEQLQALDRGIAMECYGMLWNAGSKCWSGSAGGIWKMLELQNCMLLRVCSKICYTPSPRHVSPCYAPPAS